MTAVAPSSPDDESLVLAAVRELVLELHSTDRGRSVALDSTLDRDLGLDSLAVAELLVRLEGMFGVHLPSAVLATAETPRDLLAAVRRAPQRRPVEPVELYRHPQPLRSEHTPDMAATLLDVVAWHAHAHPGRLHVRVLGDAGPEDELTCDELAADAASIAAGLAARGVLPGDRVSLMLPTGRQYFTTFAGILLAGAVPVPVYPPARPSQLEEHLRRQARILDNAQAVMLVAVPEAQRLGRLVRAHVETVQHVVTADELAGSGPTVGVAREADDVALLQYTSGSTGNPKGVVLTHANLLANIRAMGRAAEASSSDTFVSWLPLYHDMGLIGAWLSSLYFGMPLVVMSPLTFLSRPSRWLWGIASHRGTLSAAPNFAYELCLRKVDDDELDGLDLSSWRLAFNGAEPVHADTVTRFAERFARYGLSSDALTPVYGLAEACVGLAFPPLRRGPHIDRVTREPLVRSGRAELAQRDDAGALAFVSCGLPLPDHEIRVVDSTGNELGERQEGRVEFRGPSATAGYFHNATATRALFHHDWLDTGDVGYFADGELFVTGRVKDLIIRAGRNLHPEELETAVGDIAGIRKGCVAVFSATDRVTLTEQLVVVAETREIDAERKAALRERINDVAVDLLGTPADQIVLAAPGTVLKTSSGKIRRAACRERYERGTLGAGRGPVWWQVARFTATAALQRLRHSHRVVVDLGFNLWVWVVLALIGGPTLVAVAVLPRRAWRRKVTARAARALAHLTGTRLTVSGTDRVPTDRPVVFVANHPSYLDGLALAAVLASDVVFVVGEVFAAKPVIGFLLRRIGCEFVERTDREHGVADTHRLEQVGAERSLVFFPEGGLARAPGLRRFHLGGFVVAATTGHPVVPVAIRGTRSMLRAGHRFVRPGSITITIGEPIEPRRRDWDAAVELEHAARDAILEHCGEPNIG